MPSADSLSPFERDLASVTRPISLAPFGMIDRPSEDFTGSVVRAVTGSPGLAFFESNDEFNSALMLIPAASVPSVPVFSEGDGACAYVGSTAPAVKSALARNVTAEFIMMEEPPHDLRILGAGTWLAICR